MKYGGVTLGQVEAAINILGGMDQWLRLLAGELVVKAADLLKQVATVTVPSVQKFIVSDHFKIDTSAKAKVKIAYMSDDFRKLFLGMTEENVESMELAAHQLLKSSLDAPIMTTLGDRTQTWLAYLWQLLLKQANGQEGTLLVNGYANILYIIGNDDNFWAVNAHWDGDAWGVHASSAEDPDEWGAGRQVLSRK